MRLTVCPLALESHARKGRVMEGVLKVFALAVRIAIAWTLLSLLLTAFWALLVEVRRRFPSRPPSKSPVWEERQLSDQLQAVHEDFCYRACIEALVLDRERETVGSDAMVVVRWRSASHKR
jgi:hypothetical protein